MALPASRMGDMHLCPTVDAKPHIGGTILPPCCPTVHIGKKPQARASDMATCAGPPDVITSGASTVLIRGLPAARMTDNTAHGGMVFWGCLTVHIGGPTFHARTITSTYDPATKKTKYKYGKSIVIMDDPSDPNYQSKAIAALVRLETTPTMQRAINDLEASGHTQTIIPYVPPNPSWGAYNAYCQADNNNSGVPGVGSSSTVAWSPGVDGFGPAGTTPDCSQPGSDVLLGHEMIHGVHNAKGDYPSAGPYDYNGINVPEDRNTVGVPARTYDHPGAGDPLNGTPLPDTSGLPYTENSLRQDYANSGIPSPVTGNPPVQRPSYYDPTAAGGPGSPW